MQKTLDLKINIPKIKELEGDQQFQANKCVSQIFI